MKKKLLLVSLLTFAFSLLTFTKIHARSEGFFIGGGYNQPLMFTWKKQGPNSVHPGNSISFWPGAGGFVEAGYEFKRPDWLGIQLPFNWNFVKVNKDEWAQLVNADVEALFHLSDGEKRFDPYVGLLIGFTYLSEGEIANDSKSYGPDFGASFGFRYSLHEYAKAGSYHTRNLSIEAEIPVKFIMFVKNTYFTDKQLVPIIGVPIRFGVNYKF